MELIFVVCLKHIKNRSNQEYNTSKDEGDKDKDIFIVDWLLIVVDIS